MKTALIFALAFVVSCFGSDYYPEIVEKQNQRLKESNRILLQTLAEVSVGSDVSCGQLEYGAYGYWYDKTTKGTFLKGGVTVAQCQEMCEQRAENGVCAYKKEYNECYFALNGVRAPYNHIYDGQVDKNHFASTCASAGEETWTPFASPRHSAGSGGISSYSRLITCESDADCSVNHFCIVRNGAENICVAAQVDRITNSDRCAKKSTTKSEYESCLCDKWEGYPCGIGCLVPKVDNSDLECSYCDAARKNGRKIYAECRTW